DRPFGTRAPEGHVFRGDGLVHQSRIVSLAAVHQVPERALPRHARGARRGDRCRARSRRLQPARRADDRRDRDRLPRPDDDDPARAHDGPAKRLTPRSYRPPSSSTMTHVLHRTLNRSFPVAVSGEGTTLVDAEGKRYLDASGGAAVSCLGHGHPEVRAAIREQIDRLEYAHTSFFTSEVAETLADLLIEDRKSDVQRE